MKTKVSNGNWVITENQKKSFFEKDKRRLHRKDKKIDWNRSFKNMFTKRVFKKTKGTFITNFASFFPLYQSWLHLCELPVPAFTSLPKKIWMCYCMYTIFCMYIYNIYLYGHLFIKKIFMTTIIECQPETCYPYHKLFIKNEECIYKIMAMQLLP